MYFKKVAIIASNNGLGHIRRSIILANSLSKKFKVTIFCLKEKINKFEIDKKVKIVNFEIKKYKNIIFDKKNNIHKFFIFKNKYDIFLSDNYPEILNKQQNAIMISNFFWHDILRINTEYYKKLEKKIAKRPIVSNYLFVSKYIKKNFKIKPVGFYGKFLYKSFNKKKNSILISFGTAKLNGKNKIEINNFLKNLIILNNKKNPIYLEPRYYQEHFRKYNIFKATFDDEMYSNIAVAIIKPGLGTITDCLSRGISIITYTKNQNKEFFENALILEKNNLGINFSDLSSALSFSMLLVKEKLILKEKFNIAKKLKWNGEKDVMKIINKIFSKKLLIYNEKYEERLKQINL
tara:strand:+ start:3651 stop:4697 length:1047 start_codon:yes stop_codon:yes gene_type:complete